MLNTRRESILETLIEEYIHASKPISSEFLARSGRFGFSSATMRNEFAELTHEGYIEQPHTSAGRIPTNKGYRYYVDALIEDEEVDKGIERAIIKIFQEYGRDVRALHGALAQYIARATGNLVFSELLETAHTITFGFEQLAQQPEFEDPRLFRSLARVIDRFEREWRDVADMCQKTERERVFIGRELALLEKNISSVVGTYHIHDGHTLFMSIIGPNRMDYERALGIFNTINRLSDEYHGAFRR